MKDKGKACAPIDWLARLYMEAESDDFTTNEVTVRQQFDLVDLVGIEPANHEITRKPPEGGI